MSLTATKSVESSALKDEGIKIDQLLPPSSNNSIHISIAEFGRLRENIEYLDGESSHCTISVKQYFAGDVFYRERGLREVQFDELYFDLIFVGKSHAYSNHQLSSTSLVI
jgi:hypothetical protein